MTLKYKCPYCPKKYQSENDLAHHVSRMHGKQLESYLVRT